jgi:hypothetical protein
MGREILRNGHSARSLVRSRRSVRPQQRTPWRCKPIHMSETDVSCQRIDYRTRASLKSVGQCLIAHWRFAPNWESNSCAVDSASRCRVPLEMFFSCPALHRCSSRRAGSIRIEPTQRCSRQHRAKATLFGTIEYRSPCVLLRGTNTF